MVQAFGSTPNEELEVADCNGIDSERLENYSEIPPETIYCLNKDDLYIQSTNLDNDNFVSIKIKYLSCNKS